MPVHLDIKIVASAFKNLCKICIARRLVVCQLRRGALLKCTFCPHTVGDMQSDCLSSLILIGPAMFGTTFSLRTRAGLS